MVLFSVVITYILLGGVRLNLKIKAGSQVPLNVSFIIAHYFSRILDTKTISRTILFLLLNNIRSVVKVTI